MEVSGQHQATAALSPGKNAGDHLIGGWGGGATGAVEYVILIDFSLQQWSRERVSILRYTYMACLDISTDKWIRNR